MRSRSRILAGLVVLLGLGLVAAPLLAAPRFRIPMDDDDTSDDFEPSFEFMGFVDTSLVWPISDFSSYGDEGAVVASLDQVEIDFVANPVRGLWLRTDINFFPAGGTVDFDTILEQGWIGRYFGGLEEGFFLIAGKRNARVGVEYLDPIDMYQFSQGLLFANALPQNITGFFTGYHTDRITALAWFGNPADTAPTAKEYGAGAQFLWSPAAGRIGATVIYEPFGPRQLSELMIDLEATWFFGDLTAMAELNYAKLEEEQLRGDQSIGFLAKLNYVFTNWLSVTARYDYLDNEYEIDGKLQSATAALLFGITESFGAIIEYRADISDITDAVTNETSSEVGHGLALELTAKY